MLDLVAFTLLGASGLTALACLLWPRASRPVRRIRLGLSLAAFLLLARALLARGLPAWPEAPERLHAALDQGLAALAVLALAFAADAAIRRWIWEGRLGEAGRPRVPNIVLGLASLGGYALTLLLIASQIFGLDVTAVAATSGVVAIVLGVSAQQTLGQVFAGLALNLSRPFRIGDSLQVDGVWGVVAEADWRAVTLRTYEGNLVTLPNTMLAAARLTNLDAPTDALRQHIPFVADAEVPPGRVRAAALAALQGLPAVLPEPAPLVLLKSFEERGVLYEAIFWHRDPNLTILRRDEAAQALWYALRRARIPLAVNRRWLERPAEGARPAPQADVAQECRALALQLGRTALFGHLPPAETAALAERARTRLYAPGEAIFRAGEAGASLFMVLEGQASVRAADARGQERELYVLAGGALFGHMSALTGAPRLATVRAEGHLALAEIAQADLAPVIAAHPEVVEAAAREILRLEEEERRLRGMPAAVAPEAEQAHLLRRLSERIRAVFAAPLPR